MIFKTRLLLSPLSGRRWAVAQDLRVYSEVLGKDLVVPEGFVTDLSSMPRFLWWESTPSDYPEAGVIHDYLYATQFERAKADRVYKEALESLGSPNRAKLRYVALRIFGGIAYKKDGEKK
jgi:hypothetical protein